MQNVLITGKLHDFALDALKQHPKLKIDYRPDCSRQELEEKVQDCHILISRSETNVDRNLIAKAPQLKLIARAAVGVGNIDLQFATERGILVINTPGKNTNSAAELTMGLILSMLRKIPAAHTQVKNGGWDRHRFSGFELRGKSIGIVGLGNVGHRVAKFARGFDMDVFAYDPYIAPEIFQRHQAQHCRQLHELVSRVDILTLHVPLNKETTGMITRDLLRGMKPGSYLVNAARGGIVSEKDLLEFLHSNHLAGAGIDTFEVEPPPSDQLIKHPNVSVTPHIGASTEEAQLAIAESIVNQVTKIADGGVAEHPVNLPEMGVIDRPVLQGYAVLAEKLGLMAGQILEFNPQQVTLHYRGDIAGLDQSVVRLSWMKGFAGQVVNDYVSFVNVSQHFQKLGIKMVESRDPDFRFYKSAISVEIKGAHGETLKIGGVVFDDQYARLSLVNDFYFEVEPQGTLLLIENWDRPGVIGNVGTFLAQHGVNINSFSLSRNRRGGKAMSIISIDNDMAAKDIAELRQVENIESVKLFRL